MIERLLSFLRDLPSGGKTARISEDDPRIAAAALLYHLIDADGVRQDTEWDRMKSLLKAEFGLDGPELEQIVRAGEKAEAEAVDLYMFTSVLKRHMDEEQRIRFIRMLWEVVHADGDVHELEDNIIWRIAELIGVDRRDRIEQRQEAALNRKPLPGEE